MEKPQTRLLAPDAVKGLCILLMVFGHVTYVGYLSSELWNINAFIYSFHMPIFLILSGIFFRYDKNWSGVKNVIVRIGIPYFVFIFMYLFGLFLVRFIGIKTNNVAPESIKDFFWAIFIHPYGAYWFLYSILLMQVLALAVWASLVRVMRFKHILFCVIFAVGLWLICFAGLVEAHVEYYFVIGMLWGRFYKKASFLGLMWSVVTVVGFIVAWILFDFDVYSKISLYGVVWCVVLLNFFWSFFERFEAGCGRLFSWFGKNTLPILCLHAIFLVILKPLNSKFLLLDQSGMIQAILVTGVTALGCIFTAKFFDKVNLSKFFFGTDVVYKK